MRRYGLFALVGVALLVGALPFALLWTQRPTTSAYATALESSHPTGATLAATGTVPAALTKVCAKKEAPKPVPKRVVRTAKTSTSSSSNYRPRKRVPVVFDPPYPFPSWEAYYAWLNSEE